MSDIVIENEINVGAIPPGAYFRKGRGRKYFKVISTVSLQHVFGYHARRDRVYAVSNKGYIEAFTADTKVVKIDRKKTYLDDNLFELEG